MINNTIAKRYAKALVQLGSENGLIDRFRNELSTVNSLFAAKGDVASAFANPAFTVEQKRELMKELIARCGCSELVANFLMLLVDKNRVAFLGQIVSTYESLADEQSDIIRPLIRTAFPLDDAQVAGIQGALEKKSGKKVVPEVALDKELMGGVIIQIGDTAYDSSVKTQLKRIQDILQKG